MFFNKRWTTPRIGRHRRAMSLLLVLFGMIWVPSATLAGQVGAVEIGDSGDYPALRRSGRGRVVLPARRARPHRGRYCRRADWPVAARGGAGSRGAAGTAGARYRADRARPRAAGGRDGRAFRRRRPQPDLPAAPRVGGRVRARRARSAHAAAAARRFPREAARKTLQRDGADRKAQACGRAAAHRRPSTTAACRSW